MVKESLIFGQRAWGGVFQSPRSRMGLACIVQKTDFKNCQKDTDRYPVGGCEYRSVSPDSTQVPIGTRFKTTALFYFLFS